MSKLPFPSEIRDNLPQISNKGLRFEKFFNQFDRDWKIKDDAKSKFLDVFNGDCGNTVVLNRVSTQQLNLVRSLNGKSSNYKLDWHMVTGMGNPHPTENGFLWHPTLDVPYIPGSQVKGIIRSLIEQYFDEDQEQNKQELLLEWFGSDTAQGGSEQNMQVGRFIFFDAIPIKPPTLVVDIMTPHMGKWYSDGNTIKNIEESSKIPADWHDPNPIPFLAIKDAVFLFSIAERNHSKNTEAIDEVFELLDKALHYLGVGAKTQTGYGYMSSVDNE